MESGMTQSTLWSVDRQFAPLAADTEWLSTRPDIWWRIQVAGAASPEVWMAAQAWQQAEEHQHVLQHLTDQQGNMLDRQL